MEACSTTDLVGCSEVQANMNCVTKARHRTRVINFRILNSTSSSVVTKCSSIVLSGPGKSNVTHSSVWLSATRMAIKEVVRAGAKKQARAGINNILLGIMKVFRLLKTVAENHLWIE